jgi:hypothetical protein
MLLLPGYFQEPSGKPWHWNQDTSDTQMPTKAVVMTSLLAQHHPNQQFETSDISNSIANWSIKVWSYLKKDCGNLLSIRSWQSRRAIRPGSSSCLLNQCIHKLNLLLSRFVQSLKINCCLLTYQYNIMSWNILNMHHLAMFSTSEDGLEANQHISIGSWVIPIHTYNKSTEGARSM